MRSTRWAVRTMALLLALFVLSACPCAAFAAEEDEYGAKFLVSDDPSQVDVDIINFKARLNELGFYVSGVNDAALQSKELDDLTMAAVKLVCRYNPEFTYYDDGVTNVLYWRVMGETDGPLVTPLGNGDTTIAPGSEGDAVTRVQNRLNQLGYDVVGAFAPGVYDDVLQQAIDEFVRCNKLVYEPKDGITPELQDVLFSEDAKVYTPPGGFADRVLAYVKGSSELFGVQLPNAVVLLIGLVLLGVIVFLIIRLTGKKSSGKAEKGVVCFTIEYGGKTFTHTADGKTPVRIGRSVGDFPLDMSDVSISREHCEIVPENGSFVLRDTSSYGTKINGEDCHHDSRILYSGDVIEVGRHKITIKF